MNDSIKVLGNLKIVKTNKDNVVVDTREIPNLVVDKGKALIAQRLVNPGFTSNAPQSLAIGDDSTSPTTGQTALVSEIARANSLPTVGTLTNSISTATITYVGVFGPSIPSTTKTLKEAAILDTPNIGGNMLCRTTFSDVSKGTSDTVTITWNITIA